MKLSVITCLIFTLLFTSYQTKQNQTYKEGVVIDVSKLYAQNFLAFQDKVNQLVDFTAKNKSDILISELQKRVSETRLAYKKVEFLFDYNQTPYNRTFINGAPFTKYEEDFTGGQVLNPNGLQTLDLLVNGDDVATKLQQIQSVATDLKSRVDLIASIHIPLSTNKTAIIEALRSGIISIFTLSLTGFDTPGSSNAINESHVSLETMLKNFEYFKYELKPEAKSKFKAIKHLYLKGIGLLESNPDFDSFDRMTFLKQVINPIYESLLDFQTLNGIDTKPFKMHAQNYASRNLFAKDFLDTNYYGYFTYLPLNNQASITLGKKLFEDSSLSKDGSMSCVTCHNPKKGFTDGSEKSPTNQPHVFGIRNTPTVINAGYSTRFFWDMREYNLEKQVAHVVDNSQEFNTSFEVMADKLRLNKEYVQLFENAYKGIDKVTINRRSISNAIAAYVNSLQSFNSPFDQYVRNETNNYSERAKRGFNLFAGKAGCASCHFMPVFNGTVPPFYTDSESEVLGITKGLDSINPQKDTDLGRAVNGLKVDNQPFLENSFKTVTLRNIDLTAPYMHNGSFKTLEEVMDFYNLGGGAGMRLDIKNQTLPKDHLDLSKQEKEDIIIFLKTLTDTTHLVNYSVSKMAH